MLLFTAFTLAGSVAPDIDGFFEHNMNNHRNTLFHAQLACILIASSIYTLFSTKKERGDIPVFPSKLHAKSYMSFWKYYANNTFLLVSEIGIITIGILVSMLY